MLPDGVGLDHIQPLVTHDRLRPILYITAQLGAHAAIEAIKWRAYDYQTKPIDFGLLKKRLNEAIEYRNLTRLPVIVATASPHNSEKNALIGRCGTIQDVFKNIGRLANLPDAVLIEGEVGTGKEMVARAIHSYGLRQQAEFRKITSEELSEGLQPADKQSLDQCFSQCLGGTLLLEEVTSLTNATQTKLLSALQDKHLVPSISRNLPADRSVDRLLSAARRETD